MLQNYAKLIGFLLNFFPIIFLWRIFAGGAAHARGELWRCLLCQATIQPADQFCHKKLTQSMASHHRTSLHQFFKCLLSKLGLSRKHSYMHYSSCSVNRSHKFPLRSNSFVVSKPLQLIYSDVWDPAQTFVEKCTYYVIFVDYYSKCVWFYPMKKKSDVATLFPKFKLFVENFLQPPIISIFNDNGGEYMGLSPFLKTQGISHYTTSSHTPKQNGITESCHCQIVETGLFLLHYDKLP